MFAPRYFPVRYFAPRYFPPTAGALSSDVNFYYEHLTDIYISKSTNAGADATNTVQLKVKEFSVNKGSRVERVQRNTLDPNQVRSVNPFISQVDPVNFTFTTYVLPVLDTNVTSPEEYLWVSLMGVDTVTSDATDSVIDFADGNVPELQNLTLWFNESTHTIANHRIDNAVIDSATFSFDINGIAEISWSGRALGITDDNTPPAFTDRTTVTNYIKNKPSSIALTMNSIVYNLALTGGNITFNNQNTFYQRTRLGETSVSTGHVTGNRLITGNLNFYLKSGTAGSAQLFNTLLSNTSTSTYEVTHLAEITIDIGGASSNPRVTFYIPEVLLEIARQDFGEIFSISVPFTAKEINNYSTVTYSI